MKNFKEFVNESKSMPHDEIIDLANEKDFTLTVKGKKHKAALSGKKLSFPVIVSKDDSSIHAEINWKQAEKIANGELKNIEM